MKSNALLGLALVLPLLFAAGTQAEPVAASKRPALMSEKAGRSLLVDLAYAGKRLVAVGERGHILFSDNDGKTWAQAKVPVALMLTAVVFANAQEGWAVGHDGVILYSSDAGASWRVQRASNGHDDERAGSPLLDVWFADNQTGYAVGAYGYFLTTRDGGVTWDDTADSLNNPEGLHLNAIVGNRENGAVYIAGERGLLFRSLDKGNSWSALASPFDGSFFGISPLRDDLLLTYGLQGRLYRSADKGSSWQLVPTGITSGLNDAIMLENGQVLVFGNAGVILNARDAGLNFIPETRDDRQSIMAALPLPDGAVVTVGEGGIKMLPVSK